MCSPQSWRRVFANALIKTLIKSTKARIPIYSWENERCKHTMFYVLNSLIVFSFFGCFMLLVDGGGVYGVIAWRIWVKYSHIQESVLCWVPETTVLWCQGEPRHQQSLICRQRFLHSEAVGARFCCHNMTYLRQQISSYTFGFHYVS